MRTQFRWRLWTGVAALALAECDADPQHVNGCFVEAKVGSWGGLQSEADWRVGNSFNAYERNESPGCPIQVVNAGERVFGGSVVYDYSSSDRERKETRRAHLRFTNSRNEDQFFGEFYSEYGGMFVRVYEMFGEYPALTGRYAIDDNDFMIHRILSRCCEDAYLELKLDYKRDNGLAFNIVGPDIPAGGSRQTWNVRTSSGGHPHSYTWYMDGAGLGSGTTYTAAVPGSDFDLRVDARDIYGRTATTTVRVDVDGVRASLAGPEYVYSSDGGGTWSAAGTGGLEPYAFDWYVDDRWAGNGPTWRGYPGDGIHTLVVRMQDGRGAAHQASINIEGMNNDSECALNDPSCGILY